MKVVQIPNPVLTTPAQKVEKVDAKIHRLVREMEETLVKLENPKGVGLAAPQVGVGIAVFIMKSREEDPTLACINPEIVEKSEKTASYTNRKFAKRGENKKNSSLEGCLSISDVWAPVKRADRVLLKYMGLDGKIKTKRFSGFKAVIVQHEVDHLNGILFTKRAVEQNAALYEEVNGELQKIPNF